MALQAALGGHARGEPLGELGTAKSIEERNVKAIFFRCCLRSR